MNSANKIIYDKKEVESMPNSTTKIASPILILSCGWLFYLYEYVLRVSTSVITNDLMMDFKISAAAVGTLAAFYYFAYVPLQVPCGIIVDRFGPRKVVSFSALLCVSGAILFAKSDILFFAQFGRLLIGAGSACAYISCMKIASIWFKPSTFALIVGTSMMMGTFGGMFGGKPFANLANNYGWRNAMLVLAFIGVAVMIFAFIFIKDKNPNNPISEKETALENANFLEGLKIIASKKQSWIIGVYGCMMYLPLSAFAELWGVPYLMQRFSIDNEYASYGSTMVFIGMATGCLVTSSVSNFLKSRKKVLSISANFTFLGFLSVLYIDNISFNTLLILLFVSGIVSGISILYFASAKESNPAKYSATTVGFTNALVMVSGLVFQPLLGIILDISWNGKIDSFGKPIYSTQSYQLALTAVLLAFVIARILVFFIKETYHKRDNAQ